MTDHDHDHPHHHPHDHSHPHGHEAVTVADGPVVLDIGGGYGALILTLPDSAEGTEIHARRPGERGTTHTGVWRRSNGSGTVVTAVFPELLAGSWTVLDEAGEPVTDVVIDDGAVTQLDLR